MHGYARCAGSIGLVGQSGGCGLGGAWEVLGRCMCAWEVAEWVMGRGEMGWAGWREGRETDGGMHAEGWVCKRQYWGAGIILRI